MLQGLPPGGALLVMQGFDMLEPRLNTRLRGFAVKKGMPHSPPRPKDGQIAGTWERPANHCNLADSAKDKLFDVAISG